MSAPAMPPAARRRGVPLWVHAAAFAGLLGLWTWKLLAPAPVPEAVRSSLADLGLAFLLAKALHFGAYALLAVLAGTLPVPRYWRAYLIGLLVLHGVATEVGQTFVPNRTGRAADVVIDWAGITAGLAALRVVRHRRSDNRTCRPAAHQV